MAVRKSIDSITKEFQQKINKAGQYWLDRLPADLGNHAGVVQVPGSPSMVYARVANGQVVQVFNNVAPNIADWKVYIGRDKSQPTLFKVIDSRWVYNTASIIYKMVFHHEQHEYPAPDTVWVRRDQFLPLLVLPKGGFHVRLYGDVIYSPQMPNPFIVENQSDIDLSAHAISYGAKFVLMEVLPDGTLNYVTGTLYSSISVLRNFGVVPAPTAGAFPICAIEFYAGQTEIRRDDLERNIIDLRMFTSNSSVDAGYEWHSAEEVTTLDNADEFGVWDDSESALKKITWASLQVLIDLVFGTHLSDAEDAHDASAISIADAGNYYTSTEVEGALQELAVILETHWEPVTGVVYKVYDRFHVGGALAVTTNAAPQLFVERDIELHLAYIHCKTPGTASSTIIDINLGGTTVYSTQANRPTLAYNDADGYAPSGTPDVTLLHLGDILTIDIDQIATGAADLEIILVEKVYEFAVDEDGNPVMEVVPNE